MELMEEDNVLNTSLKLAQITIGDKKPLSDVTNTPIIKDIPLKDEDPKSTKHITDTSPNEDDQARYNKLITKAKKYTGEGMVQKALELNKAALQISHSDKLAKKIAKMEAYLKEYGEDSDSEEDNGLINVGDGFYLYKELHDKLYDHQKQGVLWMWSLYRKKKGGILGDDMGLGKTIQVIAFLSGMFDMEKAHYILIVMPVALVVNWENEFNKWAPGINVTAYHGTSKKERERSLAKVQRRGGVCITTYGMVVTSWEQLGQKDGRGFTWDYMILDEGHKIKNPTKTTKGVYNIPARNRLVLTGTPIQNNLKELWALFDFSHHGTLLGTARTFKMEFDTPISRSREKDATINEKKLGLEMSEALKRIIAPFFLRRTKTEVTAKQKDNSEEQEQTKSGQMPNLTRKNELVIWLYLTPTQQKIYEDFLQLDDIKELLMTTKSPLVALTVLKKICDHPRLLSTRACAQLGLDGHDDLDEEMLEAPEAFESAATKIQHVEDSILIQESGKLIVLVELLDNLKSEGHRCLVFSQSRKMLDIIQKLITNRGHNIMRLDGTISSVAEREDRIQKFQTDQRYTVFLLTTQVGGVGLTLTAADRVVIYDPSWNPATDAQAVDRVFRIGQDKNVVIYRLITCATVEEKIYRRQIFKDSINRQTTGNSKNPYRYFTKQDLRELFILENPRSSTTQQQLQDMHTTDRKSDVHLDAHIAFLHSLEIFGISDHDLMFSQEISHEEEEGEGEINVDSVSGDFIQSRIQRAQQLIEMESSAPPDMNDRFNEKKTSTFGDRPAPVPKPKPSTYTMFNRPPVINNDTVDLTRITSNSPTSPIQIDDDDDDAKDVQEHKNVPNIKKEFNIKLESVPHIKEESSTNSTDVNHQHIKPEHSLVDVERPKVHVKQEDINSDIPCEIGSANQNPDGSANQNLDNSRNNSQGDIDMTDNVCDQSNDHSVKNSFNHHQHHHHPSSSDGHQDLQPCVNTDCVTSDNESTPNINFSSQQPNIQRDSTSHQISSPFKIPGLPVNSPALKKTPKQKERIVEEELIISPDPGSPVVSFSCTGIPHHVRTSASKLSRSILFRSPDSPFPNKSSPPTNSELYTTVVENSPMGNSFESCQNTVKRVTNDSLLSTSPAIQTPVLNILDYKSPVLNVGNGETPVIEDSMEESDGDVESMEEESSPVVVSKTNASNVRRNVIASSSDEEQDDYQPNLKSKGKRLLSTDDEGLADNDVQKDLEESDENDEDLDINEDEDILESEDDVEDEDIADVDDIEDVNGVKGNDDGEDNEDEYEGSFVDDDDEEETGESEYEDSEEESQEDSEGDDDDGFNSLPEDLKQKFNDCVSNCKKAYSVKNYEEALAQVLQALEIYADDDLQQQALKIHKKISQ